MADLQLFVAGLNITQHLDAGSVGDRVTVSLYGLAHGLAHDWWTIFGVRDQEISLARYRTGYLLPDLRFGFDGAAFEIQAHQRVYEQPDVRFWAGPSEVLSRDDGEAWLSGLIDEVLLRLRQRGMPATSAALRWQRVMASRRSEEAVFCEAAGSLGIDPYQIDDATATFIEKSETLFRREALVEFVSGAGDVDRRRLLEWVEKMARNRGFQYRLANLRPIVDQTVRDQPHRPNEKPWAAGYRLAHGIRQQLNLGQNGRFKSFKDLAIRLGASKNYNLAPQVDGIRALRRDREDGLHVHLRNHGDTQEAASAHLFAFARAVGDAACFPEPQLGPVTELRSAYRQAAGRAFAAEFLAPSDEIEAMRAERRDVVTIANEFAVSQQVIENQIMNRKRIVAALAG
ncbi:ImmA/IrrE family metallo-endopeptidase [Rhodopila sp.]|uniref:ImmA/IrrE family metallo-endopeptidase n=1 Tax=Rhodopila sp. TaxID=2480087 RepID=UPI003D0D7DE3